MCDASFEKVVGIAILRQRESSRERSLNLDNNRLKLLAVAFRCQQSRAVTRICALQKDDTVDSFFSVRLSPSAFKNSSFLIFLSLLSASTFRSPLYSLPFSVAGQSVDG